MEVNVGLYCSSLGLKEEYRFITDGVGIDPREAELYGPVLGTCLIALTIGIPSFANARLVPEYTGPSMNPARCFAFTMARGCFQGLHSLYRLNQATRLMAKSGQWTGWLGHLVGSLVLARLSCRTTVPFTAQQLTMGNSHSPSA